MTEAAPRKHRTRVATRLPVEPAMVDLETAAGVVALSTNTFQMLVCKGDAPRPRQLSPGRGGWLLRELREWAEARPVSNLLPPVNARCRR